MSQDNITFQVIMPIHTFLNVLSPADHPKNAKLICPCFSTFFEKKTVHKILTVYSCPIYQIKAHEMLNHMQ